MRLIYCSISLLMVCSGRSFAGNARSQACAQTFAACAPESEQDSDPEMMRAYISLHDAVKNFQLDVAQKLLTGYVDENGKKHAPVDVNFQEAHYGHSALHVAITYGFDKMVDLLIKHNANVNLKSKDLQKPYPIHLAAVGGKEAITRLLIRAGADVNKTSDIGGQTALHKAAKIGYYGVVILLVRNGKASTKIRDNHGRTALNLAQDAGWTDIVSFLSSPDLKQYEDQDDADLAQDSSIQDPIAAE